MRILRLMMTAFMITTLGWVGMGIASDDSKDNALERLETGQDALSAPGWVIPSALNVKAKAGMQNRSAILNETEQGRQAPVSQPVEAGPELQGSGKGGGVQLSATPQGEPAATPVDSAYKPRTMSFFNEEHENVVIYNVQGYMVTWISLDDSGTAYYHTKYDIPADQGPKSDVSIQYNEDEISTVSVSYPSMIVMWPPAPPEGIYRGDGLIEFGVDRTVVYDLKGEYENIDVALIDSALANARAYVAQTTRPTTTTAVPERYITQSSLEQPRLSETGYGRDKLAEENTPVAEPSRISPYALATTPFDADKLNVPAYTPSQQDAAKAAAQYYDDGQAMRYVEHAVAADQKTADLGGMAADLRSKTDRTETDTLVLQAVEAAILDSDNIDGETMRDFAEVARYLVVGQSMKDALEGADFGLIKSALDGLVKEQAAAYKEYLDTTDQTYAGLAELLSIDLSARLPDEYLKLTAITPQAKRKILVDIKLNGIRAMAEGLRTGKETLALSIEAHALAPYRLACYRRVKDVMARFVTDIKLALAGASMGTIRESEEGSEALVIIDERAKE